MVTNNISKLFGVLVVGGAVLAQADTVPENEEPAAVCQIEVRRNVAPKTVTCLDGLADDKILEAVKKAQAEHCISPWCNCWLG